eukprot:CAMPEP_0119049714 /NCGR_PEP_ID=MMETSP1177-20130426/65985_1 /TAXON_ID=2985 /ORGANISM="Ochromonas sp, Strain CCMP1899" /LENGTH=485 /DNA_ID=CAMNT_0007027257 /DNA_START=378 /DNA_END=1835 /DNA_ORIENTATION=+
MARAFGKTATEEESLEIEAESLDESVIEDKKAMEKKKWGPPISLDDCFRPIPLPLTTLEENQEFICKKNVSVLSGLLEACSKNGFDNTNCVQLTIYLPNYESMNIEIADLSNFKDILKAIFDAHKGEKLEPVLYYHAPEFYVMRMHEGDGEPDMDFPAIEGTAKLKAFNLNEFCLCLADEDADPPPLPVVPPTTPNPPIAAKHVTAKSLAAFSYQGGSSPNSNRRKSSLEGLPLMEEKIDEFPHERTGHVRKDSFNYSENVSITIPNAGNCIVRIDEHTTLGDLLPKIARTHRLRLFSDEYAFKISDDDQARLKIMSPIVDLNQIVQQLGVKELELQKKVYADSVKISIPMKPVVIAPPIVILPNGDNSKTNLEHIVYTETTASVYQEWNVNKKNKYGAKQERIIGLDGKKVYNKSRFGGVVHRSQRDISSIRKVEIRDSDRKTIRITWGDNREIYDIEYTCDTKRDCVEIAAKILFLITPLQKK